MRIRFNLQTKAILIISIILFVALFANTFVLTVVASGKYKNAVYTKTIAIMEGLQHELSKALNLGISLEYIEGLNDKLREILERDKDISYSMIVNTEGRILFHSDPAMVGKDIHSIKNGISYRGVTIYRYDKSSMNSRCLLMRLVVRRYLR